MFWNVPAEGLELRFAPECLRLWAPDSGEQSVWRPSDERQSRALPTGCGVLASLAALAADARRALPSPSRQRAGRHACARADSRLAAAPRIRCSKRCLIR